MRLNHPEPISGASYSTVELTPGGDVVLVLDQRRLPREEIYVELRTADDVARGIKDMVVRGAPAIGIAAAYGLALEAMRTRGESPDAFVKSMARAGDVLNASRPTAVNLRWAVERVNAHAERVKGQTDRAASIAELARTLHREDVAAC